jgi:hypothetical protein
MIGLQFVFSKLTYVKVQRPMYENTIASLPWRNMLKNTDEVVLPYGERLYHV